MAEAAKRTVIAALLGNLAIAVTKFAAALFTGSSAMLSEAVHSLVDTGNEVLLLYGMRRARLAPDPKHPIGYGRELYFWSFIVALLLFAAGGGVSIVQGIAHLRAPEPIERPGISYAVLGLSLLFEGASWTVAYRGFRQSVGDDGLWRAIRRSKDPPQFMVLLEDSAAIIGILIALAGTWAAVTFADARLDGIASIAIGVLLVGVSVVLARESKGLLIGERGDEALEHAVRAAAAGVAEIERVNGLLSIQLAPDQVVVAASIEFADALTAPAIERAVVALEDAVRAARPDVHLLFVKPQTASGYAAARDRLLHSGAA